LTVLTIGIALILHASVCHGAIVQVNIERASGAGSIEVGQGVTVNVLARVNQAASAADGLFTYDLDLIIANISGQSPILQVQSVLRPGTSDVLLGGSNGGLTPFGLHAVYGGYLETSHGVDAAALLFSVNLLAVAPGTVTLTPGPAVDPYGFDFVLYQSSSPTVLYGPGLTLSVTPGATTVPLPAGAVPGVTMGLLVVVSRFARQRRRIA
jgi:hypothetical protein